MIVASVNANKRLGAEAARARFRSWLERHGVTLALVQEAWRVGASVAPRLPGMKLLGGDHALAVWVREAAGRLVVERPAGWWQTVLAGELVIHSVHLDPYSAAMRVEQLRTLAEQLPVGPNLVLGDFNLAPRSVDGMYGTSVSEFTTARERHAFAELLKDRGLRDATARDQPEFTLSRRVRGADSSFRCDGR
jgi:endonuclease/exonuclease/phosphatase (EEP) superfamily protein YafD